VLTHNSEIKGSVHHTNERILEVAKQEVTSKQQATRTSDFDDDTLEDLLDFTESFGAYAKEVMPSVRSERRRSSRYAPTSPSKSILSQGPPKSSRSEDFRTTVGFFPSKELSKSKPVSSQPATSDVFTGSHSSNSMYTGTSSDPVSSTSSLSIPVSRTNNARSADPANSGFTEPQDFKRREYINPPNQSILSPPTTKSRTGLLPLEKSHRIGRHTIVLGATRLHIDNYSLRFKKHATGNLFLQALMKNQDKIDALVRALAMENDEETWDGIPGWLVSAHRVTMLVDEED
jgi:hypothetical protein